MQSWCNLQKKNIMNKGIEELKTAYNTVFNEDGTIKACGRDACAQLIKLMKEFSTKDVGNENTGMINIEIMKAEYQRILQELS